MKEIAENIFMGTEFTGVTLGAILEQQNLTYIDSPLLPEHTRLWRIGVTKKKKFAQNLILLDSHPDRAIGTRYLDCPIIAQESVLRIYQNRPITFKPINHHSGSEWEKIDHMNGFRWIYPEIVFSQKMDLHQEKLHILTESHPGPSYGASWVNIPERKVVFIGDAALKGHAPFLAEADFDQWLETLSYLNSGMFADYIIISGRGGQIKAADIEAMKHFLTTVKELIEEYAETHTDPSEIAKLIPQLKVTQLLQIAKENKTDAIERLTYGLQKYFTANYMDPVPEEGFYEDEDEED